MRISSNYITRPYSQYQNNQIKADIKPVSQPQVNFGQSFVPKFIKRMLVPKDVKKKAKFHCYLADKMKLYFDFNYGRRNYTVISIGRSLASVVETLGKKRRDVVCLPLSGLSYELPSEIKNIEVYREFLKSKGLTKEIIAANPDRHYVLVDNSISGRTLRNAKTFLSREDLLGNPDRLEIKSAEEIYGDKYNKLSMNYLFASDEFQEFSPVGCLHLQDLKYTFEQANYKTCGMYETKSRLFRKKLFDFSIQDIIDRSNKKRTR